MLPPPELQALLLLLLRRLLLLLLSAAPEGQGLPVQQEALAQPQARALQ